MSQEKRIYLDYAATTPVDPEVLLAMQPYWSEKFGNAGSLHKAGQEAMKAVDDARAILKDFVGAKAQREIIFTGSATEANNIAIQGVLERFAFQHGKKVHAITTMIEHSSVLEPFKNMEARGIADVTYLTPDTEGIISPKQIRASLRPETVLVSIGYANNEIGVMQQISEIGEVIRSFRELGIKNQELGNKKSMIHNSKFMIPYFHTDAVQAAQFLEMNADTLGVDLMTFSAHKLYGPKGVGSLYIRNGVELAPLMYGGGQEYDIRPSTHNVPLIAGFGRAIELLQQNKISEKIKTLRDYCLEKIFTINPRAELNGSKGKRLPNNIHVSLPGTDAQTLLIGLSEKGICISSGAACSSRAQKPSHVIQAIGKSEADARSSIRITLGKETTKEEIDYFIETLSHVLYNK